jgi:hypothetical protein
VGHKFTCAWDGCKKTTRNPVKAGWKGGMYRLDEHSPGEQPTNSARHAWLEFCPDHCDKRVL